MAKYYAAMDAAAKCRGVRVPANSAVTSAPGGNSLITSSEGSYPGGTAAAGSGAGDSAEGGITPGLPAQAATGVTEEGDGARRRRAVAENCPVSSHRKKYLKPLDPGM